MGRIQPSGVTVLQNVEIKQFCHVHGPNRRLFQHERVF